MVTRRVLVVVAAMAAVVGGVAGAVASAQVVQTFTDVPPSHPFHHEIEWGAANGIVSGYADGSFKPASAVSRQAAIAFVSRYNDQIEIVKSSTNIDSTDMTASAAVACPAGKRPVGGGGMTGMPVLAVRNSGPTASGGGYAFTPATATGWRVEWVQARDQVVGFSGTAHVWAICVPNPAG